MKTGISIKGGNVTEEAVEALADGIVKIFESAHENRIDQETIRAAIRVVEKLGTVSDTAIHGCSIGL